MPPRFGAIILETSATQCPSDLRALEARPDVLSFTWFTLAAPPRVEGVVTRRLFVACGADDTELAVHPGGHC